MPHQTQSEGLDGLPQAVEVLAAALANLPLSFLPDQLIDRVSGWLTPAITIRRASSLLTTKNPFACLPNARSVMQATTSRSPRTDRKH